MNEGKQLPFIGAMVKHINHNLRGEVLELAVHDPIQDTRFAFVEWETKSKSGGREKNWVDFKYLEVIQKKSEPKVKPKNEREF